MSPRIGKRAPSCHTWTTPDCWTCSVRRIPRHRVWSKLGYNPVVGVGHLQKQLDEIEPVYVLPVLETCVDFIGVLVERSGEEALLLGGCSSGETLDAYANMHSSSDLTRLCRELFVNLLFE